MILLSHMSLMSVFQLHTTKCKKERNSSAISFQFIVNESLLMCTFVKIYAERHMGEVFLIFGFMMKQILNPIAGRKKIIQKFRVLTFKHPQNIYSIEEARKNFSNCCFKQKHIGFSFLFIVQRDIFYIYLLYEHCVYRIEYNVNSYSKYSRTNIFYYQRDLTQSIKFQQKNQHFLFFNYIIPFFSNNLL